METLSVTRARLDTASDIADRLQKTLADAESSYLAAADAARAAGFNPADDFASEQASVAHDAARFAAEQAEDTVRSAHADHMWMQLQVDSETAPNYLQAA